MARVCIVCDTFGCCDSREPHTYDEGCMLDRTTPKSKVQAELEKVLEAVKELGGPHDKKARQFIRNRMTEDGQLVIGNQTLIAAMLEE